MKSAYLVRVDNTGYIKAEPSNESALFGLDDVHGRMIEVDGRSHWPDKPSAFRAAHSAGYVVVD